MPVLPLAKRMVQVCALVVLYAAAGVFGPPDAFTHPATATLWMPAGIGLAALLVTSLEIFPAVFVAAFIVEKIHGIEILASLGIATGATLEAVVAAALLHQFARIGRPFERPRHVVAFAAIVVLVAAPIGASAGVGALFERGLVPQAGIEQMWTSAWLADITAIFAIAPMVVLWTLRPRLAFRRRQRPDRPPARRRARPRPETPETVALLLGAAALAPVMFTGVVGGDRSFFPLACLLFPVLGWAALRFGARETTTVMLVFAGIAVWSLTHGLGPFVAFGSGAYRLLQVFLAVTTIAALGLAAMVDERNRLDTELHLLAVTDPLTGLANYRHLTSFIDREIQRAQRTIQPFAVLLLDVNNLKTINDKLGHNVGSRVLVRLADALRRSCRVTDLIARYGGDEFAVVLPACNEEAARAQATRLQEELVAEGGTPPLSVSLGIAMFPRDGEACDDLLDSADNELYTMKGRSKKRSAVYPG